MPGFVKTKVPPTIHRHVECNKTFDLLELWAKQEVIPDIKIYLDKYTLTLT